MKMFHRILLTTDLTEKSETAVRWATFIARKNESRLDILHITESIPYVYKLMLGWTNILDENANRVKHELFQKLTSIKEELKREGLKSVDVHLKEGEPHWEIIDFIEYSKPSLVVMGAGRDAFGIGSVAQEVASLSSTDVLVVKGDREPNIRKIAFTNDFSNFSRKAFRKAYAIAKSLDANLLNVHVFEANRIEPYLKGHEALEKDLKEDLKFQLNTIDFKFVKGILVEDGYDGYALSRWLKDNDVDMVFVGYKGSNDRTRFIGHFADEVLKSSEIPVFLIRKV